MASKSTKPAKTSDSDRSTPKASTPPATAATAPPVPPQGSAAGPADAPAGAPVPVSGEAPTNVGASSAGSSAATSASPGATATSPAPQPVDDHELQLLAEGRHGNPHAVFGAHPHEGAVTVRVLKPLAESVTVLYAEGSETLRA